MEDPVEIVPAARGPYDIVGAAGFRRRGEEERTRMTLSLTPPNPFHTFGAFVVCASNEAAFREAADARTTPLCLHGPTGAGKSHLLHAVANDACARRVALLAANALTEAIFGAVYENALPALLDELTTFELLIVDDVVPERMGRHIRGAVIDALRHAVQHGARVVVASPNPTALLPEAVVAEVGYPDEAVRLELARRAATRLGLTLPAEILSTLASSLPGSPRELQSALATIAAELAASPPETIDLEHLAYAAVRRRGR
jgi:chromosomal replication initiator protein